jgi:hypothetical protein
MKPICDGFLKGEGKPCAHSIGEKNDFCELPEAFRCTEWIRRYEPTLSYSTIRDSYCKRKLYLSYICGYQLIVKPLPMRLGEIAGDFLNYYHDKDEKYPFPNLSKFEDEEGVLPVQLEAMTGLFRGYTTKEFDSMKGAVQPYFQWMEEGYPQIHGYMDLVIYDEKIGYEFKYSKRPEAYSTKFIVQDQIATYFLGFPHLERITLRAIQVPDLRLGKNETHEIYKERVYQDFMSRPLHYINDTNFWRSEFNKDELREKYKMIAQEILRFIELGRMKYFYQSNGPNTCFGETTGMAVNNCEYLDICTSGVVSEQLYKKREVRHNDKP